MSGAMPLPEGEYAIVEVLGHRTYVGRIGEVERFGAKLMAIEPLFDGALLPAVLIGGASIYQFTPVTAEVAAEKQPRARWQLPSSVSALLPPRALPAPGEDDEYPGPDDDGPDDSAFVPDFLEEEASHV